MPRNRNLRRALAAVATGAALALSAAPARAVSLPTQLPCLPGLTCEDGRQECANAATLPAKGNLKALRRATLCLLNAERTARDLEPLRQNRALRGVATRYAKTMVRKDFFDHVSPQGSTFIERIKRSAYLRNADGYTLGENLAWGGGLLASPERIVRGWMRSPGHRENILNGRFRDIGIGVVLGVPVAGDLPGATYVNEFGTRDR